MKVMVFKGAEPVRKKFSSMIEHWNRSAISTTWATTSAMSGIPTKITN